MEGKKRFEWSANRQMDVDDVINAFHSADVTSASLPNTQ